MKSIEIAIIMSFVGMLVNATPSPLLRQALEHTARMAQEQQRKVTHETLEAATQSLLLVWDSLDLMRLTPSLIHYEECEQDAHQESTAALWQEVEKQWQDLAVGLKEFERRVHLLLPMQDTAALVAAFFGCQTDFWIQIYTLKNPQELSKALSAFQESLTILLQQAHELASQLSPVIVVQHDEWERLLQLINQELDKWSCIFLTESLLPFYAQVCTYRQSYLLHLMGNLTLEEEREKILSQGKNLITELCALRLVVQRSFQEVEGFGGI